jgi:dihydropteroate synthase
LVAEGADVVDVGGESTRPGADPVPADVELDRVLPVIRGLAAAGIVTSVDTMKPEVADAALEAGAEIVNDVSGFGDPEMRAVAARWSCGVVIMHMQGDPRTMQLDPCYDDVVGEVGEHLADRARLCREAGVDAGSICVDPGIGFGKTVEHNLELLRRMDEIVALGYPVMVGASRKSFLGRLLDLPDPTERDLATAITVAMGVERGAILARVHEPVPSHQAARLAWAIVRGTLPWRA